MSSLIQEPLAIVGLSCRLPGADGLDEYWRLLIEGRSAIGEVPAERLNRDLYFDPERGARGKTYSTLGGLVGDRPLDGSIVGMDPSQYVDWDSCHLNMCEVAGSACLDAGYDLNNIPLRERTGVYIGHSGGSDRGTEFVFGTLAAELASYLRETERIAALPADQQQVIVEQLAARIRANRPCRHADGGPTLEAHSAAALTARTLQLGGPHLVTDAACASSLMALIMAALAIQSGQIDMAIVGGASYGKSDSLILFSQARSCSATGSRPFDDEADGLISSEGYAAIVIKTLSRARSDGDAVRAVISGLGASSDGRGRSLWAPRKEGQLAAMDRAYDDTIAPSTVQYVEAHATSTQIGDATEMKAMTEFFTGRLKEGQRLPIGSVKSNIGHTLETAGIASLVKTVLAMQHRVIPPTINLKRPNSTIDWDAVPFFVPTKALDWPTPAAGQPRRAAVSSFGIGGLNVHLIVDEAASLTDLPAGRASHNRTATNVGTNVGTNMGDARSVHSSDQQPIAIIGRGAILPGAFSVDALAELIAGTRSAIVDAPRDRWRVRNCLNAASAEPWHTATLRGGFITDYGFDWRRHRIPPKQIAQANPLQFMLLDAAYQAMGEAGYDQRAFDRDRTAVVVGTIFGGEFGHDLVLGLRLPETRRQLEQLLGERGLPATAINEIWGQFEQALLQHKPALIDETGSFTSSTLASRVSKELNLMGGAMAVDAGECSSFAALDVACNLLRSTACQQVLCAAAQRSMDLANYEALSMQGRLACDGRAGMVPGEGVVMLLLKRLSDAQADGDQIFGVVRSIEGASDHEHAGQAVRRAAERLVRRSGADATAVTVARSHVAPLDDAERKALAAPYGADVVPHEAAFAEKTGHLLAANGLAGLLYCMAAEEVKALPKLHLSASSPTGLAYQVLLEPATQAPKPATVVARTAHSSARTVCFGGDSPEAVDRALTQSRRESKDWGTLGASLKRFEPSHRYRLAICAQDQERFDKAIGLAARSWRSSDARPMLASQGVVYGTVGESRPRVAFLFPGQGSQYPGMMQRLPAVSAAARGVLDEANQVLRQLGSRPFEELVRDDVERLREDLWSNQITILIADLMTLAAVREAGVEPDRICGHSFGEFACLVAAKACSLEQAIRITQARTAAVEAVDEPGALLSLATTASSVEAMIERYTGHVAITHYNAPDQTVIGGLSEEVEKFAQLAVEEGIAAQRLRVPCAFHTALMAPAQARFRESLDAVTIEPASMPWLMNVGGQYCSDPTDIRSKLAQQIVEPVHYVQLVSRLADEGVDLFVEVGPQQVLTRLNQRILAGRDVSCLSLDASRNQPEQNMALLLAQLDCLGYVPSSPSGAVPSAPAMVTHHEVEHFDATRFRRQRRRGSAPVGPARHRPVTSIARFDATASRRNRTAEAAGAGLPRLAPSGNGELVAPAALEQFLIDFVVEHTGYPAEILELDWDLEADLGIDSIKKAQLFGELRELFDIESALQLDPAEIEQHAAFSLDNFRTLRQVLDLLEQAGGKREWLEENARANGQIQHEPGTRSLETTEGLSNDLEQFLIDFVVEHTGYPPEIVELEADFEADLGIDSIKKAQLFGELREHFTIEISGSDRFSLEDFRTLQSVVDLLREVAPNGLERVPSHRLPTEVATAEQITTARGQSVIDTPNGHDGSTSPDAHRFASSVRSERQTAAQIPTIDPSSVPYRTGRQWGRDRSQEILASLQDVVDQLEVADSSNSTNDWSRSLTGISPEAWAEIHGIADGAGIHVSCIAAHYDSIRPEGAHGPSGHLPDAKDVTNTANSEPLTNGTTAALAVTHRHVLRMVDAPQRPGCPSMPPLSGAALIVGQGPVCDAIRERFNEAGQGSYVIDPRHGPDKAASEVERVWASERTPHLFLVPLPKSAPMSQQDAWCQRRDASIITPYWACQRWMSLMTKAELLHRGSLVAISSLGGSFGLSGNSITPDSALTGLLKAILIESWMNGHHAFPIKVIDAPSDQSPTSIVDGIFCELAVPSYDTEVSWAGGRRQVMGAVRSPLRANDLQHPIPEGGNWVCIGGGRGITAFVAKELAVRHKLRLHLLGTAPLPQVPETWRATTATQLKALKLDVMTSARERGENPIKAWQNAEKAIEINRTLSELRDCGVDAHYYQCDISCRETLACVLDEIRHRSGPIDAVLQGAGVGKDGRFEKKDPRKVDQCLRAKVDGTLALMELTRSDPLQYFVAFGSISGRFGANGHTDYSLANDMMAKLVGWYRTERPEVKSVAFHWHAWGDIGMATKPETKLALEMIDMQFMPAAEGLEHLFRELQAGAPEPEVLITDDRYCRLFYPDEASAHERTERFPLLDRGSFGRTEQGEKSTIALCPVSDPFLVEHRLDDKPLLPVVVGLELLCEAAARFSGESSSALCLTQIQALHGLRFHTDRSHDVSVHARELGGGRVQCELVSDVLSRSGKLVERDRVYLKAVVERDSKPARCANPAPPKDGWHRVEYPRRGSKFFLGSPLRCLQEFGCDEHAGWGRVAAPAPIELTGPRHSVTGWIVPSAALDACLYAVGLLAWFAIEPGVALPESIGELILGRFPDRGEACLVETRFLRREGQFGWFDFTLYGVNGEVLIDAKDYRIVWLPTGNQQQMP